MWNQYILITEELSLNISKNQVTYLDASMYSYFRRLALKIWAFV